MMFGQYTNAQINANQWLQNQSIGNFSIWSGADPYAPAHPIGMQDSFDIVKFFNPPVYTDSLIVNAQAIREDETKIGGCDGVAYDSRV
jgi:hypothetical protein